MGLNTCHGQAGESLHTPGFQENKQLDITKKPVAGGTATGNVLEVKGSHSMLNDSTRVSIRKVDVSGTDTKQLNRLVQDLRAKLDGQAVKIKPPTGKAFSSGGALIVWGYIARHTVQATDAKTTREAIERVLKDAPEQAAEIWAQLEEPEPESDVIPIDRGQSGKPTVVLPLSFNDPMTILNQILPHFASAGIYYRDGSLSRIVRGDTVNKRGVARLSVSGPTIEPHDVDSILPVLCCAIDFQAEFVSGQSIDLRPKTPRVDLLKWLLRLREWPGTPYLSGITSGPFMRHDGTVCTTPGYDDKSGWYLDYDGFIEVPETPTREQADESCRDLLDLVTDFEWANDSQKCGWIAYLLTLIARPGIEGHVPAFVFSASTPGAGKSLLVNIANIIAFGHPASGYKAPQHRDDAGTEWKKLLFAFALTGNPSLVVSNYPSGKPIGCAEIDGQITEHKIIDRVLQRSETKSVAWIATIAFTGNNLSCATDFGYRSIWACMEPSVENPRERTGFRIDDLEGYARKNRDSFLRKALTILRWHATQNKPPSNGKNFGSFEEWSSTVRDAIMHLTGQDVTQNGKDAVVTNQESDELATLIAGLNEYYNWRKEHCDRDRFTVAELHADLNDPNNASAWNELREVLDASLSLRQFNRIVGALLPKHKNRVSNGLKLTPNEISKKRYWRIVQASEGK